jgi:preprotein translocase subunit SecE
MSTRAEQEPSRYEIPLTVFALVLVVVGVLAFYLLGTEGMPIRLAALLLPVAGGAFLYSRTQHGAGVIRFIRETNVEVRKVVWPTRQETIQTTGVVFVAVLLSSILLWGLDSALALTVKTLTSLGG